MRFRCAGTAVITITATAVTVLGLRASAAIQGAASQVTYDHNGTRGH